MIVASDASASAGVKRRIRPAAAANSSSSVGGIAEPASTVRRLVLLYKSSPGLTLGHSVVYVY